MQENPFAPPSTSGDSIRVKTKRARSLRRSNPLIWRAKWVVILLRIWIGLASIELMMSVIRALLLAHLQLGGKVNSSMMTIYAVAEVSIFLALSSVGLAASTVVLLWMRSAYLNLRALSGKKTEATVEWMTGCWFIPVLNLFKPYELMKEIVVKSFGPEPNASIAISSRLRSVSLKLWWASWIIGNVASSVGRLLQKLNILRPPAHVYLILLEIFSLVCLVVAARLLVDIVKVVTKQQQVVGPMGNWRSDQEGNSHFRDVID